MEKHRYLGPTRHAIRGTLFIRLTGYADGYFRQKEEDIDTKIITATRKVING